MTRRPVALAILAHPDDESWICAGTLLRLRQAGWLTKLVTLTRGEHSRQHLTGRVPPSRMAQIRTKELKQAADLLQIGSLRLLRFPDGGLSKLPRQRLVALVVQLLRQETPDIILTFAPDGVSGHPDHATVAATVRSAVAKLSFAPVVFEYDFSDAQRRQLRLPLHRRKWKLQRIDVSHQVRRKIQAIKLHRSQFIAVGRLTRLSPKQQRRLLSAEHIRAGVVLKNYIDARR